MCIIIHQGIGGYSCNVSMHSARGQHILTRVQVRDIVKKELSECNEDTRLVSNTKEIPRVHCCGKVLEDNVSAQQ